MLFAAILLATALAEPARGAAPAPVRGKAVIAGTSFELRHAWIIRGPDHFEEGKMDTYIVMAKDDISTELSKCPTVKCAIWDVLKNGLIMTSEGEGAFWVRAVHPHLAKEQQISARGWTATVDQPDHIVGRLHWEPQGRNPIVLDLDVDAALLKSFPLPAPPNPGAPLSGTVYDQRARRARTSQEVLLRFLNRSFLVAAAVVLAGALAAAQDLTIVSKVSRDGGAPETHTSYLSPERIRMAQGDGREAIIDYKLAQMISIDHRKRTYSVTTEKDIDEWVAKMEERMNSPEMRKAREALKELPPRAAACHRGDGRRHVRGPEGGHIAQDRRVHLRGLDCRDGPDVALRGMPIDRAQAPCPVV